MRLAHKEIEEKHFLYQDDLEPDTEERAMAVLWSAPEAIEKKVQVLVSCSRAS